jgi:VIT1/CCC1 family predicted Fe2+/Mn2+ transporter
LPYLLSNNYLLNLALALLVAILIIACFNFYIATVRAESFRKRFLEMVGVSLSVAA